jgi:hypothetical protein
MPSSKKRLVWSEEDLARYRERHEYQGDKSLKDALAAFRPEGSTPGEKPLRAASNKKPKKEGALSTPAADLAAVLNGEPGKPKKRRGISVRPIMDSLKEPVMTVSCGQMPSGAHVFSVWLEGARVLTINELISIYQYRKFETYAYKNRWKELMQKAVDQLLLTDRPPFFESRTRLVLYRRGTRLIDLDSLPAVFKYATDGLKKAGLIAEDNPNVIVEVVPVQEKGTPAIGLRLEEMPDWTPPLQDWQGVWHDPVMDLASLPEAEVIPAGRARKKAIPPVTIPAKPPQKAPRKNAARLPEKKVTKPTSRKKAS